MSDSSLADGVSPSEGRRSDPCAGMFAAFSESPGWSDVRLFIFTKPMSRKMVRSDAFLFPESDVPIHPDGVPLSVALWPTAQLSGALTRFARLNQIIVLIQMKKMVYTQNAKLLNALLVHYDVIMGLPTVLFVILLYLHLT